LATKAARVKSWRVIYILRLRPEHIGLVAHAKRARPDLFALSADELPL